MQVPVLILSLFCISKLKEKINRGKEEVLVFCRNTRKTKLSSFVHFLHCFRQRLVASIRHCWRFSDRKFLHEAKFFRWIFLLDVLMCYLHVVIWTGPRKENVVIVTLWLYYLVYQVLYIRFTYLKYQTQLASFVIWFFLMLNKEGGKKYRVKWIWISCLEIALHTFYHSLLPETHVGHL